MENNNEYKKYIRKVLRDLPVYGRRKKEIESDLLSSLQEREESNPGKSPEDLMGLPEQVAQEFRENLGLGEDRGFEYRSEKEILGLPLVHINLKRNGVAKGIFAFGPAGLCPDRLSAAMPLRPTLPGLALRRPGWSGHLYCDPSADEMKKRSPRNSALTSVCTMGVYLISRER